MIIIGGFFVVQLLMASDLFKIDQISVQGNSRLDPDSIVALSDIQEGLTLSVLIWG